MINAISNYWRRRRMHTIKPFVKTADPGDLRISFCDTNADMTEELAKAFSNTDAVEVLLGDLLNLSCDAILSPANSFGDMGGGIDKHIDDFFRGEAQRQVMAAIQERFFGELPVGQAHIISTNHQRFPFLICAPTMRVPGNVSKSINAYLAFRAALIAIHRHNETNERKIRSLASPGLGTGVGGIPLEKSALQMRTAYKMIMEKGWREVNLPALAPFAFSC